MSRGGRANVEACPKLDIRELNRRGWRFGWLPLSFSSGASICLTGTETALKLSYRASGVPVSYEIPVVRTAMHYGGSREWLVCPACRKRFAILYIASDRFRCRRCNGLAYRTQNETLDGRMLIKAERLWKRAGHEFSGEGQRPRYMKRQTYERLMARADQAYMASWHTPKMDRLLAKARR